MRKTVWKSQNLSKNRFSQGKHHLVPAVLGRLNNLGWPLPGTSVFISGIGIGFLQACTNNPFQLMERVFSSRQREIPGFPPEIGFLVRIIPGVRQK